MKLSVLYQMQLVTSLCKNQKTKGTRHNVTSPVSQRWVLIANVVYLECDLGVRVCSR